MKFPVPINDADFEDLPDHTDLIENIAERDAVDNVIPVGQGNADRGRFVSHFYIFHEGRVSAFALRRDGEGGSDFDKIGSVQLTNEPIHSGTLWDADLLVYDQQDEDGDVEELKHKATLKTKWLSTGEDPDAESYNRPEEMTASGLPDCDHGGGGVSSVAEAAENYTPATLAGFENDDQELAVVRCRKCGLPIAFKRSNEILYFDELISRSFAGFDSPDGDLPVSTHPVEQGPPASNAELALAYMNRAANVEIPSFDVYARLNRGYLIYLDNALAGYLTWSRVGSEVVLQQVYITEAFRGDGLSKILMKEWFNDLDAERYFAVRMNSAGHSMLESIDHYPDGPAHTGTVFACRDTTDARVRAATRLELDRHGVPLPQSR